MSTPLLVVAVLFVFGTFAAALAYAQIVARGLVAPGARALD